MPNDLTRLPSPRRLLARVLDTPDLADQVRALPPGALAKLVDQVGLEDAGEIVALATTEQLERLFDEDLWKNERPGEEERFDDERFIVWLEALLEAGDALVATRLSELPEDLVTLAVHKRVLVVSLERLMSELGDEEGEAAEKALSNCLSEELDAYQLVARTPDGWDAVLAALLALDREHHDLVARVLERCADMSSRDIDEQGGLYEALTSEQMLESDVAAERDDRRAESGYVEPRAAAAFLRLASGPSGPPPAEHDALTRAYFRDVRRVSASTVRRAPVRGAAPENDLSRLLIDAGVVDRAETPLLSPATTSENATRALFIDAMRELGQEQPNAFAERSEELAYLANVLVAACTVDGRRVRPIEGVTAAIAICDRGLAVVLENRAPERDSSKGETVGLLRRATEALATHPADGLFRAGWKELHLASERSPDLTEIMKAQVRGVRG